MGFAARGRVPKSVEVAKWVLGGGGAFELVHRSPRNFEGVLVMRSGIYSSLLTHHF